MERERLSDGRGNLEFTRITEIVLRRLPAVPAVVADIGGGPGRYALWLASLGYQVEHRDLMPLHVEQFTADTAGVTGIHTAVGDVRDLDLPDASVDAVLLLGPLYHLIDRAERAGALFKTWPSLILQKLEISDRPPVSTSDGRGHPVRVLPRLVGRLKSSTTLLNTNPNVS